VRGYISAIFLQTLLVTLNKMEIKYLAQNHDRFQIMLASYFLNGFFDGFFDRVRKAGPGENTTDASEVVAVPVAEPFAEPVPEPVAPLTDGPD
jgi:hypothetical protein